MKRNVIALLAMAATGCVAPRAEIKSAAQPPAVRVTVDFTPVFEARARSLSVPAVAERANLKRVLLSPNLVFESSRSSAREPDVSGPRSESVAAPNLTNALGKPVEIWLSSLLMNELVKRGAGLVAPAMSRHYADTCEQQCDVGTWVERVLLRYQRASSGPKGSEELAELPTALLAVRELGLAWRPVEVIAIPGPGGDLSFAPRRRPSEDSACPEATIELPQVRFSAEMLSMKDGRILARIDETITPSFTQGLKRQVDARRFKPVQATGYKYENRSTKEGVPPTYSYVARWETEDIACANALEEYKRVRDEMLRQVDLPTLARDVILLGLSKVAPTGEPAPSPGQAPMSSPSPSPYQ